MHTDFVHGPLVERAYGEPGARSLPAPSIKYQTLLIMILAVSCVVCLGSGEWGWFSLISG